MLILTFFILRINKHHLRNEVENIKSSKYWLLQFGNFPRKATIVFVILFVMINYGVNIAWLPETIETDMSESVFTIFFFLAISFLAFFPWLLLIHAFGRVVIITEIKLISISPWHKIFSIDWEEIDYIEYSAINDRFILFTGEKKLFINNQLKNIRDFQKAVIKYLHRNKWNDIRNKLLYEW